MTPDIALILCRFLMDTAALLLFGAHGLFVLALPLPLARSARAWWSPTHGILIGLLALAGLGKLASQTAMLGDGWSSIPDLALWGEVAASTRIGQTFLLQIGLGLVLALVWWRFPLRRSAATLVLVGLLLASISLSGHAAMGEGWTRSAQQIALILHALAAAFWLGALPEVARLLRGGTQRPVGDPTPHRALATRALIRFSNLGHVAVAVTLATGCFNGWLITGGGLPDGRVAYQQLLLAKILAVGAMVALALVNRYVLVPRLSRQPDLAGRRLRHNTLLAIALGLLALALVAVFGLLEPSMGPMAG